jgi:hypothetical protein
MREEARRGKARARQGEARRCEVRRGEARRLFNSIAAGQIYLFVHVRPPHRCWAFAYANEMLSFLLSPVMPQLRPQLQQQRP